MRQSRSSLQILITPLVGSIAALATSTSVQAVDILRSNDNATALNTAAAWQGGVLPTAADVIVFDSTGVPGAVTATTVAATNSMGASLSVLGIRVANNVGGTINTTQYLGIHNNGSTTPFTLSLGSSGVDMSVANQALRIQAAIALTADQNWVVNNANTANNVMAFNNGEDLSFDATSAAQAFDLGGFTVNASGTGGINITSGFTLNNGTINISNPYFVIQGGGNRVTNINNNVTLNVATGGLLHFQSNSGAGGASMASSATINLNGGQLRLAANNGTNTLNVGGIINVNSASTLNIGKPLTNNGAAGPINITGNLSGSGALSFTNTVGTAPVVTLSGDNSGYTGTITFGGTAGRVTRLGSATSGSAAATWDISAGHTLSLNAVSVNFGTLNGAGEISTYTAGASTASVGAGTFSGVLSNGTGTLALTKVGAGTLILTGANTYSGATTVNGGRLIATSAQFGQTPVTVADAATFGVRVLTPNTSLLLPSLSVGSVTGGSVAFELGAIAVNPTVAPLTASTFNPNVATRLILSGTGFQVGQFPLLDYDVLGGLGFGGLSLVLPPRVAGVLVDNVGLTSIDVNITGQDQPKWTGAIDGIWDLDDGTGTGTVNWREVLSGNSTRYIQTPTGADSVLFDDSATGTTSVTFSAALAPIAITFNNSTASYSLSGTGGIGGGGSIVKNGTATVRIANTGANTFSGGTTINAGTLELGDGVTIGGGSLGPGTITNHGSLVLNRPDSLTVNQQITGFGGITQTGGSVAVFTGAVSQSGPIVLGATGLTFSGGGTLSGAISGAGPLRVTAGVVQINGSDGSTNTGGTTVSGGRLELAKTGSTSAVGGDVTITGTGTLGILTDEQIPNTATINVLGSSADSTAGTTGRETVANVLMNASAATGQFIMRNNFEITGTATVNNGILGVASAHNATVNGIVITGGIVRVAGSGGLSTLNIGPGGIVASGGTFEVKFNLNNQDAIVNLGGDVTTSANFIFNNAGYTGPNLSQINLSAPRTFNIGAGTTTTVRTEIAGIGGIIKTGAGTLDLTGRAITYLGDTLVNAGTLVTSNVQNGTPNIGIADNAALNIRLTQMGATLPTQTITIGTATGGTIRFDLAGFGNPTAAAVSAGTLSVGGTSTIEILGAVTPGVFTLIDYVNSIGGAGFAGLTIKLPLRVGGNLVNNTINTSVDVNILGTDTPKWKGNLSNAWDIDDGTGTGTANWSGNFTGTALRYLQSPAATDAVIFDDSATGTTTINLTTVITPANVTANNSTLDYTLTGPGKISGSTGITKTGLATFTLANTTPNDYTGLNNFSEGAVSIGDGVAPGAGSIGTGAVTVDGTLVFNRPDDFSVANAFSGFGTMIKARAGTTTLTAATTFAGAVQLSDGTLRFSGGGNLSGIISGSGGLSVTAGTLQLSGNDANTMTGLTTVTGGTLQLNKNFVNAITGDLRLEGASVLTLTQVEQIADTATLFVDRNGGGNLTVGNETLGNVIVTNGGDTVQLILNNGFVVNNLLTISAGLVSTASAHSSQVGGIVMTGGVVRIAGNTGNSSMNVGASGITASGGAIEVGQGNGAFDAVLNLGGHFTATGNVTIDDGNATVGNLREINFGSADRTFSISDAATLTVNPDLAGFGGLIKTGGGTLLFSTRSRAAYIGDTQLNAGTLAVNGSISGSNVVASGGTLAGSGTLTPGPAGIMLNGSAGLSPGAPGAIGTLTISGILDISGAVTAPASDSLKFTLDTPTFSDLVFFTGGGLSIGSGVLDFDDFGFTTGSGFSSPSTYTLFDGLTPIVGTLGANRLGTVGGFAAELRLADNGNDLVLFVPEPGSAVLLLGGLGLFAIRRRKNGG